jgi:queuine tRNA-ribosyltransferase
MTFYLWLVRSARERILAGDFREWKEKMVKIVAQRL